MTHDEVIYAEGLVKEFGSFRALDGLDLDVRRGEVHGFLGPNGAGKSTTIRILLGLMRHDGGRVDLLGGDPWRDGTELRARLAYVPGDVALWPGLTGGQCVDILAAVHGGLVPDRRAALIERFDLDPRKRVRDYSKGNRQKVALVAALAADVDVIVLDEPTSGLDPLMEQVFQDVIRERCAEGATVLLSSHILSEVEALAERVSIIRRGRRSPRGRWRTCVATPGRASTPSPAAGSRPSAARRASATCPSSGPTVTSTPGSASPPRRSTTPSGGSTRRASEPSPSTRRAWTRCS